jgi:hypothetical protein
MRHIEVVANMTEEDRLRYETGLMERMKMSDEFAFLKVAVLSMIAANHHGMMDRRVTSNDRLLALAAESRGLQWVIDFVETFHRKKEEVDAARKFQKEAEEAEAALRDQVEQNVRHGYAPIVR